MSILKVNQVQIGQSATATQNFTITTNQDGTVKLARGNVGATTQDILSISSGGVVTANQGLTGDGSLLTGGVAKTNVKQSFTAQQTPMSGTLTDGATVNWNGDTNGQIVSVTLAGNRTMAAPTNIVQYTMYLVRVTQDATGSRTLAWNAAFKFGTSGAPTLTTTANKTDWLSFVGGSGNTLEYLGIRKDAV